MALLKDIPNRKEVWAWAIYDLANQSFQLLINTLIFSIYFKEVIVGDAARGTRIWSLLVSTSLLAVVVLSPFLGALADQRAWKRELLLISGVICSILTASLALLGHGDLALAAALYFIAAVSCGLGENFLASFLPQLSTAKTVGRVSAFGWTMSYIGALLLLGIVAGWCFLLGRSEPAEARPLFVFAGAWFLAGIVPAFMLLRERGAPAGSSADPALPALSIMASTIGRMARTWREAGRFTHLLRFLAIFFVYSMGTQSIIFFLGILGNDMKFGLPQLILFALVMSLAAGAAASVTARFQDRLGHVRTISLFLGVWVLGVSVLCAAQLIQCPAWLFWGISALLGVGLGGIGTASRAIVGAFTPLDRAAEFFGLWGMVYKLSGVCGVVMFGLISTSLANQSHGRALALAVLGLCFGAGIVLVRLCVDEERGVRAAAGPPVDGLAGLPPA